MTNPKVTLPAALILIGVLIGAILQDNLFLAYVITMLGLTIFIPFTVVVGILKLLFICMRRRDGNKLSFLLILGFSFIFSVLFIFHTGSLIDKWKVSAVHRYVRHVVPILDQIKVKEGTYPSKLPVASIGDPPSLLRDYGAYTATSDTFCFEYVDAPAGWAGGEGALKFDSAHRQWISDR